MCIYVREVTIEEGRKIQSLLRRGQNAIQVRRAMVILSSAQGYKVPEIARMYYLSEKYVRALIHRFNAEGVRSLNPRFNGPKIRGGGSRTFSEEEKAHIVELSLLRPKDLGYPFSRWSLDKLRLAILDRKIVDSISIEALRKILHSHNITIQRTRTWKESTDQNFKEKKERVRELVTNHAHHPEQGVVIAVDEFGPLALRPELGANWAEMKKPDRVPATYSRGKGGQHLLAALDLTHDKLYGWAIPRKRWWRFLAFLKYLKRNHPDTKLHVILDNHSTHKKEGIKTWAKENDVELAYTPTNASWLNPIECHFVPIKELVLRNVYYQDKKEQTRAIRRYIFWRNGHKNDPRLRAMEKRNKVG